MKHFTFKALILGIIMQFSVVTLFAQERTSTTPNNWYNLDLGKDGIPGVSTEKTYSELLNGKIGKTVIVAVIDAGVDVNHEDLDGVIWVNEDEIAGNGIDDDKNGYVDDINGWNFIGGKNGNVTEDNYELTRLYRDLKPKYENMDPKSVSSEQKSEYERFLKLKKDYTEMVESNKTTNEIYKNLSDAISKIYEGVGTTTPTISDLNKYKYTDRWDSLALINMKRYVQAGVSIENFSNSLKDALEYTDKVLNYYLNLEFDPRNVVGDNYLDNTEKYYGNNQVYGPHADHGTHVAGIIAGERGNGLGIDGIANNVKIMVLRVVPDGDERDKDVANSIIYAVDNGASIINMSFGKSYSYNKKIVDDAIKYALSKDVLLVHAAGNDSKNNDKNDNFPNPVYEGTSTFASNWVEVGASTYNNNERLTAPFSNFGKKRIDLFAPGFEINSTIPEDKYRPMSGTSMAAPVVSGVAALIRSYYPDLTAQQVKEVLISSTTTVKHKVYIPGTKKSTKLKKISKTGGLVNAYNAILYAEKISNKKMVNK